METVKVKVYAKINLYLDVTGVRADGYHELDMLNVSANIFDTVRACKSDKNLVFMDGRQVAQDNTAYKSLALLEKKFNVKMKIEIQKGIPFSAGMGGSSADASGVFYCAHKLYGIPIENLLPLALKVGCDVPYMIYGGGAIVRGAGEIVIPKTMPQMFLVVCQQEYGASTKDIYRQYDKIGADGKNSEHFNALEKAAISLNPKIALAKEKLLEFTDEVFMTGSGSAYVGVFDSLEEAKKCEESIGDCIFKSTAITTLRGIEILQ